MCGNMGQQFFKMFTLINKVTVCHAHVAKQWQQIYLYLHKQTVGVRFGLVCKVTGHINEVSERRA